MFFDFPSIFEHIIRITKPDKLGYVPKTERNSLDSIDQRELGFSEKSTMSLKNIYHQKEKEKKLDDIYKSTGKYADAMRELIIAPPFEEEKNKIYKEETTKNKMDLSDYIDDFKEYNMAIQINMNEREFIDRYDILSKDQMDMFRELSHMFKTGELTPSKYLISLKILSEHFMFNTRPKFNNHEPISTC